MKNKVSEKQESVSEWYDDQKLGELLDRYIASGVNHVMVSHALNSNEQLITYLKGIPDLVSRGKTQHIIPLNVNVLTGELEANTNHWVGLWVIAGSNSIELNYVDPMGNPINTNLKPLLKEQLKEVKINEPLSGKGIQYAKPDNSSMVLEGNTDDCGPMLVYALACLTRADYNLIKISDVHESKSLGSYLRDSFKKNKDWVEVYKVVNKEIVKHNKEKENNIADNNNSLNNTGPEKELFPEFTKEFVSLVDPIKEKQKTLEQIKVSYELGLEYYRKGELDLAQQELVKVLRPVLSKPMMKSLYVKIEEVAEKALDAIYYLGLTYLNSSYFNQYAKAAGIFQYCAAFAKKYGIQNPKKYLEHAYLSEKEFLSSIGRLNNNPWNSEPESKNYKEELKEIRELVKEKLAGIQDIGIEKISERAKKVEEIYKECTKFFVNNDHDKDTEPGLVQIVSGN